MPPKKHSDGPETVDQAIHWLVYLQREGWHLISIEQEMDWGKPTKSAVSMPVEAKIVVKLRPGRP